MLLFSIDSSVVRRFRVAVAALSLVALASCGGGDITLGDANPMVQPNPVASASDGPLVGLAVMANLTPGTPRVPDATSFLDWAEASYANLFPSAQPNQTIDVWTYRYYPQTDIYLGTNTAGDVLGLVGDRHGGYTSYPLGKISDFSCSVYPQDCAPNLPPVANAGVAQNVVAGTLVTLDGSASSDANGDALTYAWTLTSKPAGSAAVLSSATSAKPTFTADVAGTYVASLVVNDGKVNSADVTVSITAAVANVAPVANAGVAQNVVAGSLVTLDGSASSDANGDSLTGVWRLISQPTLSNVAFTKVNSQTAFTPFVPGTYVVELIVNDGMLNSEPSFVIITVSAPIAPVPKGSGVFIQDSTKLGFYKASSYVLLQGIGCTSFTSADAIPTTGVVTGLSTDGRSVYEVDPIGGNCRFLFTTPVAMKALAAYQMNSNAYIPSGYISTISVDNRLYTFNSTGQQLLESPLSGTSTMTGVPDLQALDGIDYAADGSMFGLINGAIWKCNLIGNCTLVAKLNIGGSSDIDVSENYLLRFIVDGSLFTVDLINSTITGMSFGKNTYSGLIFSR